MFLHSGASLHGHEYSERPAPAGQHAYKRSPLLRSAFATPKPRPVSLDGGRPPATVQPRRPFSDLVVPRIQEPVVRFLEPENKDAPATPMTEDAASIMSASELSDGSQPSEAATVTPSESSSRRRRSRGSSRGSRKTTTLALAYPAPRFAGKKRVLQKVSPKLFLQLQEVSLNKRPRPVIDVFPSSRIAGPVIAPRLAKRFPRLFGPKGELGSADVVLMRSEDYDTVSEDIDSEEEEGRLEQRQPVAVLSPVKKSDRTEIVLDDGSVWVAQPLPTGSFDFVRTDEHGNTTTARWARRPVSKTSPAPAPALPDVATRAGRTSPSELGGVKYTFSIINPETRRHPVMATLTPQFLDIQETYTSVSTSSGRYPPCRPLGRSVSISLAQQLPSNITPTKPILSRSVSAAPAPAESDYDSRHVQTPEPQTERTICVVDEATKLLISVTAVFLALESGWSPYFRPHSYHSAEHHSPADTTATPSIVPETPSSWCRLSRNPRTSSDDYRPPESLRKDSTLSSSLSNPRPSSRDRSPARSPITTPCAAAPAPWWETNTAQSPASAATTCLRPATPTTTTRPAAPPRATSTGAAFMQRTRIASAAQAVAAVVESSDSEHQAVPTKSKRPPRRGRLLSGGGSQSDRDKDRAQLVRHSMPVAPPLPADVTSPPPSSMDKVVAMRAGQNGMLDAGGATPTTWRPQQARMEREVGARRVQSACYPAELSPMVATIQSDRGGAVELVALPRPGNGAAMEPKAIYLPASPPRTTAVEGIKGQHDRGFGGRMKSLGHWFRRLGHDRHVR